MVLAVNIPQGQTAFQARDKRFYKRIGSLPTPMEQYEVEDAMRREHGALLELRITPRRLQQPAKGPARFELQLAVTSKNYLAAEHGAVRFVFVPPLRLNTGDFYDTFPDDEVENDPMRYAPRYLAIGETQLRVSACKIKYR